MTYDQTLEYLFSQLPMYQRVGKAAYKHDLGKTTDLDRHFGYPHKQFKSIHIAGTNGKGSVSHTLASVLQEAGYKTGLYTSPHYLDFRERIKVNGQPVSKEYVIDFVAKNKDYFERLKPSFFEMTVAMAFEYFKDMQIDVAVIEVGMGGRLDSTNIITPEVSVITNIGYDHMQFLGNTLTQIAAEKAGIIKPGIPVVIGEMPPAVRNVFLEKATEKNAPIFLASQIFTVGRSRVSYTENRQYFDILRQGGKYIDNLSFGLLGEYQKYNVPVILETLEILKLKGFNINDTQVKNGFDKVVTNTGIMGRWQTVSVNPLIILDAGHNEDGIKNVVEQIKNTNYKNLHFIFGTVNDKEVNKILRLLPTKAFYYFTQASVPRALNASELREKALSAGLEGKAYNTVDQAIEAAINNAGKNDLIFIGGSTFVVADALNFLENKE